MVMGADFMGEMGMTTLDQLERLAKAAKNAEPSDHGLFSSLRVEEWQIAVDEMNAACSPERILALIACVKAADAMRSVNYDELGRAYDKARAALHSCPCPTKSQTPN